MESIVKKWLYELDGEVSLIAGDEKEFTFVYQPQKVFLAASMMKLFVLWELFRRRDQGLDLNERILLEEKAMVPGFGVLCRLRKGLMPTLYDLAVLMIIVSDNTATNLLMDYLGIENIQKNCEKNGWKDTQITRKMFDSESAAKGLENRTSATDVACFFQLLLKESDSEISQVSRREMLEILFDQQCNNKLPGRIFNLPNGDRISFAHKTGDITAHEHDGGIFLTPQGPKILVLMTGNLRRNWEGVHLHQKIGEYFWNCWQ